MSQAVLHKFIFETFDVRGAIVRLDDAWRTVVERHYYPAQVSTWLGEALCTSALVQSGLKRPGVLGFQLRSESALKLLLAQCDHQGNVRGLARFEEGAEQLVSLDQLGEKSLLSMQLQQEGGGEPYQGIVPLLGSSFGEAVEQYFEQSEQLPTKLWLSVNNDQACGLLLQQLPRSEHAKYDDDGWNRVVKLAETVSRRELVSVPPEQLLHRLFHQEDIVQFEPQPVRFSCSCSRERVAEMLRSLGAAEVESVLAEKETIEVFCEHCNERYEFDAVDAAQLFIADENQAPVSSRPQ
ncbi:MAG: Hsp33 family molecular chaperone HslO [Xanthomonadales bacterium]|jgi:molecular chaperone Hsp33|nr:Hsp33 family molecular chaperone HslO [Xanthomonadales bacterium]